MTALNDETRAVVDVVLEALDIPHAATVGHDETRTEVLIHRIMHLQVCMESLADGDNDGWLDARLTYLRERLAAHPPVGYVTSKQARERTEAGASWPDAVSLDYGKEAGR